MFKVLTICLVWLTLLVIDRTTGKDASHRAVGCRRQLSQMRCGIHRNVQLICIGESFNRPKLCASATWSPRGLTFANQTKVGDEPTAIFVNTNDAVYVTASSSHQVLSWINGSSSPTSLTSNFGINSYGLFVTIEGTAYIGSLGSNNQILKLTVNSSYIESVANVSGVCYGLFIDNYNNNSDLYCSLGTLHQVLKISLNNTTLQPTVVAGNGTPALTSYTLNTPSGLFVNSASGLYVADCGNNRVQLILPGQLNAVTVADSATWAPFSFNCPAGIVLDSDGYLFIVDRNNHRIVGAGPTGVRCIVGCTGSGGSAPDQLNYPSSLSFNSRGSLYVVDRNNSRIQTFALTNNVCGKSQQR